MTRPKSPRSAAVRSGSCPNGDGVPPDRRHDTAELSLQELPERLAGDLEGSDSYHYVRRFKHEFDPPNPFRHGSDLSNVAIVFTAEGWGDSDEKLGRTLLNDFLITLVERAQKPRYIFLLNSAVKLAATEGDPLDNLKKLEALGVKVQLNMTSLLHFKLEKEMRVGEVVTMMDIVSTLHDVEKVITV